MARDPVYEDVPNLSRRAGDNVLSSQNNSTVILGRDRNGSVDTGYGNGPGAAAVHVIVGRKGQDPSVNDDAASLYLSQKTDPDRQAGTTDVGPEQTAQSGVIMRADCVRLSGRTDVKVSVGKCYLTMSSDGSIVLDGEISLGAGAVDRLLKGDAFSQFWATVFVPTPMGPSGPPPPIPPNVFSSRPVRVR